MLLIGAACAGHRRPPRVSSTPLTASAKTIDSLWTVALDLYQRHKWDRAAETFNRVELEMGPADRRALLGRMYLGDIYVHQSSYLQAVREYRRLVDENPADSLAPEALLRSADAYKALWRNIELDDTYGKTAQSVYSDLLTRYPNTPAAAKAQASINELQDRFARKAYKAAAFYLSRRAYDAAILLYKDLVANYPKSSVTPRALADLIRAYHRLGYVEDEREMCTFMQRDWSATQQYRESCPGAVTAAAEKPATR